MNSTRILWSVLAVALLAFAIFEGVKYGWSATGVLVAFALLPDISLIGAFAGHGRLKPSRVRFYNIAHTPWIPLAVMAVALVPVAPLELFLAGLAWLLHIAADRAFGYGRRAADGSVRPMGRARVAV